MGDAIRQRWRLWLVLSIVLLVALLVAGPNYGEAQGTLTAQAFRDAIGATARRRHAIAGVLDIFFAIAYGLLAFAVASPSDSPQRRNTWNLRRVATVLLVGGAAFDVAENVRLLRNIRNYDSLRDSSVELMHNAGVVKTALIIAGLLVFGLALIAPQFSTGPLREAAWRNLKAWVGKSWAPYWSFIAAVVVIVGLVGLHNRAATAAAFVFLIGLPFIGSFLNRVVSEDRATPAPRRQARVVLAVAQLSAGLALFNIFGDSSDWLVGIGFFVGLAFIAMALGAFVSELRTLTFWGTRRGPILIAVAVAILIAATFVNDFELFYQLIAVGLLVGLLGAELASEDYQCGELRRREAAVDPANPGPIPDTNRRLLVGCVVAAIGAALLVVGGTDPAHVAIAIVLFLAAAAMASAAADGLVIVVILVIAVVWATSPAPADPDRATAAVKSKPYFAALGDSYLSGEGATRYIEGTNDVIADEDRKPGDDYTNECRRAPTAWPFLVAERAKEIGSDIPGRVSFHACSGARTVHIHTRPHLEDGKQTTAAQLALLAKEIESRRTENDEHAVPKFVILSIGGNDAGFGDLGKACLAPGDCSELAEQFLGPLKKDPTDRDGLVYKLTKTYGRVREVVGDNVPVFVVTYPMPVDAAGRCTGVLLDVNERIFIRGFTRELNRVIASVVKEQPDFHFLDLADALTSQRRQLCASAVGAAGLNFVALHSKGGAIKDSINPASWFHNSLHPNATGHEAIADRAVERLRDYVKTGSTPVPFTDFTVSSVRDVLDGTPVPQCDPTTRPSCAQGTPWLTEQLKNFYDAQVLPLALLMLGLWIAISPLVCWGRARSLTLPSAIADTAKWLNGSS